MDMAEAPADRVRFLGIELEAAGAVLRPRAETELLARKAIELIDTMEGNPIVIDMCCGSGNLAIALASADARIDLWASDLTDGAVTAARRNVQRQGLTDRIRVFQGDMFAPLEVEGLAKRTDLIIANPPYISTKRLTEGDRAHLLDHEPREAFDGGPYGIALHQRLIAEAPAFLKPGGWLGFEFGVGQGRQIAALLKRSGAYAAPRWARNEDDQDRVVFMQKPLEA